MSLIAAALITAPLAAQSYVYVPSNTPGSGGCNVIPFGTTKSSTTWRNQRYQTLVPKAMLGSRALRICSLAFAACRENQVRSVDTLKITMAQTQSTTLSRTFATNLATRPTVVFTGKCHIWRPRMNAWANIGLQKDFLFIPAQGNLVVEVIAIGNDRKDSTRTTGFHSYRGARIWRFNWTGPVPPTASGGDTSAALKMRLGVLQPALDIYGMGCGKGPLAINATGTGKIGTTVSVNLVKGPAPGIGLLWVGFTSSPPFPFDLTGAGLRGCKLWCAIDLPLGTVAFRNGTSTSHKIPIPNDKALACFRLCVQGLAIERASPGGLALSDMLRVLVGL